MGPQPSLLSVGMFVFISDSRLTVMEEPALEDWLLVIDSAREDDTGGYECQVNTVPHTGHTLHLQVVGESYTWLDLPSNNSGNIHSNWNKMCYMTKLSSLIVRSTGIP